MSSKNQTGSTIHTSNSQYDRYLLEIDFLLRACICERTRALTSLLTSLLTN